MEDKKHTLVINAFGGPGAGKTTACMEIAATLKKRGLVQNMSRNMQKNLHGKAEMNCLTVLKAVKERF